MEWLIKLFGAPIVGKIVDGAVQAHKDSLSAGNTQESIAATLAGRELAVQQRELELQTQLRIAQIGKWYEPEHLFAYIMVVYFGKVVIWDKVLASLTNGSTDPIRGDALQWAGIILGSLFVKRGFENVARILKR